MNDISTDYTWQAYISSNLSVQKQVITSNPQPTSKFRHQKLSRRNMNISKGQEVSVANTSKQSNKHVKFQRKEEQNLKYAMHRQ